VSRPFPLLAGSLAVALAGCWMGAPIGSAGDGGDDDDTGGGITDPDTGTYGQWVLEELESPTTNDLSDVWGSAWNDVWAVGEAGVVLHYDGGTWSLADTSSLPIHQDLFGIGGRFANDVAAVGANGYGITWDGAGWEILPWVGVQFPNFRSVCLGNDGRNWAVADDGTWVNFYEGGSVSGQLPGGIGLYGVRCLPGGDAYAVGHDHTAFASSAIYYFQLSDWSVHEMEHEQTDNMYVVAGDQDSNCWTAGFVDGQGSDIYRLIEGGWIVEETSPHELLDLHADTDLGLWAAGNTSDDDSSGVVQAWHGGAPIFEQEVPSTSRLRGIWVAPDGSPGQIHAVGKGGTVVRINWQVW